MIKQNNKKDIKMKNSLIDSFLVLLLVGIFYLIISSSQKIFIASYDVDSSSSVFIETFNVGMRNMYQSITFTDKSGTEQVFNYVIYDGTEKPESIYIYRIGRYRWSKFIGWDSYEYYVTDKYIGESFY